MARFPQDADHETRREAAAEATEGLETEAHHRYEQKDQSLPEWVVSAARQQFDSLPKDRINTTCDYERSMLIRFRSPAACRLQIHSQSSAIWFPRAMCSGFGDAFAFLTSCAPTVPSLAIAIDAASLIQLGQEHDEECMVREGKKMYCDALKLLRMAVARPANRRSDALIGTVMTLQIAEANMCMGGADWRNHTAGLLALMADREEKRENHHLGWPRLIEHSFATFLFWPNLISRRRIEKFLVDDVKILFTLAQQAPGALELCDHVCNSSFSESEAIAVAHTLADLEADLSAWTAQWNRCIRAAPLQLVRSDTMPFPRSANKIAGQNPFFLIFRFSGLEDCIDHSICTASMLAIKRGMLDLTKAATQHDCSSLKNELPSPRTLIGAATACADSLCMALPYLCKPEHGRQGSVTAASPLVVARDWYRLTQHEVGCKSAARKLAWCTDVAKVLQKNGIRVPG